ncbi:MAG: hypothetical protein IPP35_05185 [Elusimicrobia bacterium]|nr:hypothetical protein [Elusimicrobiota bacterium]
MGLVNFNQLYKTVSFVLCLPCLAFAQEKSTVKFENVDIQESCYILSALDVPQFERDKGKPFLEGEFVLGDNAAYDNFQNTMRSARNMACKEVKFPQIDFTRKTILGNLASGSCAARGFEKSVLRDDSNKEIYYSVKVINSNIDACSGPGLESLNLIAVPKIQKNYKVVFSPAHSDHSAYQQYGCENGKMVARDWNGNIVQPRNISPAGGGVFGVQMDCDGTMIEKMPMAEKKLLIDSGAMNIPPPCPEGTTLDGAYCKKN